jgi:hypothetical protein
VSVSVVLPRDLPPSLAAPRQKKKKKLKTESAPSLPNVGAATATATASASAVLPPTLGGPMLPPSLGGNASAAANANVNASANANSSASATLTSVAQPSLEERGDDNKNKRPRESMPVLRKKEVRTKKMALTIPC